MVALPAPSPLEMAHGSTIRTESNGCFCLDAQKPCDPATVGFPPSAKSVAVSLPSCETNCDPTELPTSATRTTQTCPARIASGCTGPELPTVSHGPLVYPSGPAGVFHVPVALTEGSASCVHSVVPPGHQRPCTRTPHARPDNARKSLHRSRRGHLVHQLRDPKEGGPARVGMVNDHR